MKKSAKTDLAAAIAQDTQDAALKGGGGSQVMPGMVPDITAARARDAQAAARKAELKSVAIEKPRKLAAVIKAQSDLEVERVATVARLAEIEGQIAASFARGKLDVAELEAEHGRLTTRLKGLDAAALRLDAERLDADRADAVSTMTATAQQLKEHAAELVKRADALRAARAALESQAHTVAATQRALADLENRVTRNARNATPAYPALAEREGLRDHSRTIDTIMREFNLPL